MANWLVAVTALLIFSNFAKAACPHKTDFLDEVIDPVISSVAAEIKNAAVDVKPSGVLSELDSQSRKTLVAALHKAANLEQCLLNAYLIAGASVKATPAEFAYLKKTGTHELELNERRAIQFELARSWKKNILQVGVEEMLHLHYVNSLLRALGEKPHFILPMRARNTSGWIIEDWEAVLAGRSINVTVPLNKVSIEAVKNFVMYESTDTLQTEDPFSKEFSSKIKDLHEWELKFRAAEVLMHVNVSTAEMKHLVHDLYLKYSTLPAGSPKEHPAKKMLQSSLHSDDDYNVLKTDSQVKLPKFASISDFYLKTVAPLYEEAFSFGWVKNSNRDLNNELQDPTILDASLLGVGPFYHSKNFMNHKKNYENPLKNYMNVESIINEILAEGEGYIDFPKRLDELLLLDPVDYLNTVVNGPKKASYEYERLRFSHLYKFTHILGSLRHEISLSKKAGLDFEIARAAVPTSTPGMQAMEQQIAKQFNQLNLVTCMWLSRIYEVPHWLGNKAHRNAIEQLATWPLMSLGLRPFMELLSFFGDDVYNNIFRQDIEGLPAAPLHARQLHVLYVAMDMRSQAINDRMDYLAVRVLADIAAWAEEQIVAVQTGVSDEIARGLMITKLNSLMVLKEFKPQFEFRVEGGYSDTNPPPNLFPPEKNANKYEESPVAVSDSSAPLYKNTFVLHLRYSGVGTVQMATDPDPPTDEVGVTGTLMNHAADAPVTFDRSLYWQSHPGVIERGPHSEKSKGMPELGVNVVSASLEFTPESATAYVPYGVMNSVGAVQANGLQMSYQISGLTDLVTLKSEDIVTTKNGRIRVDLLKDPITGKRPFLNGENHLLWKDGEPIDPFHLSISVDGSKEPHLFRSIYGGKDNTTILQMTPEQRVAAKRAPIGFIDNSFIQPWAIKALPTSIQKYLQEGAALNPHSFIDGRLDILGKNV